MTSSNDVQFTTLALVDVPSARAHLLQTLAWMTRTKKTGGLGYSVAQAKKTHVYLALVDLGGTWP